MQLPQDISRLVRSSALNGKLKLRLPRGLAKLVVVPVALLALFSLSANTFVVAPAGAAPSAGRVTLDGFQLEDDMTLSGGLPAGAGEFSNGSFTRYFEGSCIPFVMSLENRDRNGNALNISETIEYDYSNLGQRFDDLETISTNLSNPLDQADDLSDFIYSGNSLASGTAMTSSGASLPLLVSGPTSNNGDTLRAYSVTVQDVPAGETAYVLLCARLGNDTASIRGRSTSVRLGSGGQNAGVGINELIELPSLTVTKEVIGSAAPDAWSFMVTPGLDGVSANTILDVALGQASVTFDDIQVDSSTTFTVTEIGGPTGYIFSAGTGTSCSFTGSTASATVAPSEDTPTNATCVFTNAELARPQLTVVKQVINDSGFGTKVAADFMLDVTDANGNVTSVVGDEDGFSVQLDPGQYSVSEAIDPAYAQTFGADCSGSISAGETKTCVVTNDDYPAELATTDILPSVQCVMPTGNGSYTAYFGYNSFNETSVYLPMGDNNQVTGPGFQGQDHGQPVIFAPGASAAYPNSAYSVEFVGEDVTWSLRGGQEMVSVTADATSPACPIVTPATVSVFVDVINDHGGSLQSADFELEMIGTNVTPTSVFQGEAAGTVLTLDPGVYEVRSQVMAGYDVELSPGCAGEIVQGESLICTVVYNDQQGEAEDGSITVNKVIVNHTSQEVLVTDFEFLVDDTSVDAGTAGAYSPGVYLISERPREDERFTDGDYTAVFSGDCSGGGEIILESNDELTCTITNTFGVAPTGGNGGGGSGSGGGSGGAPAPSTGITVITNVINDNNGSLLPSAFEMQVNGESPALTSAFRLSAMSAISFVGSSSGVSVALLPGPYSVTQTNSAGYVLTMSPGCSGTLVDGQVVTCVMTYDDELPVAPVLPPAPLVLGETDTAEEEVSLPVPAPAPAVLGATDEELPRTGLPVGMLAAWLGGAMYVAVRGNKK